MAVIATLCILAGVFVCAAAIGDWNWFMEATEARFIVAALSRTGARVFFGLFGLVLIVPGAIGWVLAVKYSWNLW